MYAILDVSVNVVQLKLLNVPLAELDPPITVPSIAPPLMSTLDPKLAVPEAVMFVTLTAVQLSVPVDGTNVNLLLLVLTPLTDPDVDVEISG